AFKQRRIVSFAESEARFEFRTSGTTGEGYGRHLLPSLDLYRRSVLAGWGRCGLPENEILLLMQHPHDAPHSSLARMGSILVQDRPEAFLVDARGVIDGDRLAAAAAGQQPVILFGTALAFLDLLQRSEALPLPEGSLLMETGGFKGSDREVAKGD